MDEGILRVFKESSHHSKLPDTRIIGKKIYYFDKLDSTNDLAFSLALQNKKEGEVIAANIQGKGKGRLGRKWYSPKGGIYFSIILRPDILIDKAGLITLMSAVAVCKALRAMGLNTQVKWPNDIVVGRRKLCGILTEIDAAGQDVQFLVVGVGINNKIKRDELPVNATSIYEELDQTFLNEDVLREVLKYLDREYLLFKDKKTDIIIKEFKDFSSLLDKEVTVAIGNRETKGKVQDFAADGALILRH